MVRVFDLAPLEGHECEGVIRKMANDANVADSVIIGIKKAKVRVASLLTTPLMIALLLFRYRVDQTIPETEMAFFADLFMLLLVRHDKSKPGYTRPRKSGLGDIAIEEMFNAICYLTAKEQEDVLNHVSPLRPCKAGGEDNGE